jgi:hypothetical protein
MQKDGFKKYPFIMPTSKYFFFLKVKINLLDIPPMVFFFDFCQVHGLASNHPQEKQTKFG